jgi:hypothetical protein
MNLNFSNVEEFIFWDKAVQAVLPSHTFSIFEQWRLAQRHPFLRDIGKQAVLDLLNVITDQDIVALEEYFGQRILVEKLNYSLVLNLQIPLDQTEICQRFCEIDGFNYFSTYRDDKHLYVCCWR